MYSTCTVWVCVTHRENIAALQFLQRMKQIFSNLRMPIVSMHGFQPIYLSRFLKARFTTSFQICASNRNQTKDTFWKLLHSPFCYRRRDDLYYWPGNPTCQWHTDTKDEEELHYVAFASHSQNILTVHSFFVCPRLNSMAMLSKHCLVAGRTN